MVADTPIKIGNEMLPGRLALAPMAGVTNLPFRVMCHEYGCRLGFTEMISTEGLLREQSKTLAMVKSAPIEQDGLGIQIFGDDPVRLAEAAKWVQENTPARVVNVNMGCPVPKVTKRNGGASLLRDVPLVGRIVSAIKAVSTIPVTIKIRAGWDHQSLNYLEVLRVAQESGVDALICHPRTRAQGYSGRADWSIIKDLVDHASIPIFGNGDIFTADDVRSILRQTGCAGVMIARGANGNPWIFGALRTDISSVPKTLQEVGRVVENHLQLSKETFGETVGVRLMKRHLVWYSKWVRDNKREFRGQAMATSDFNETLDLCRKFFAMGESDRPVFPWWEHASVQEDDIESSCAV